MGVLGVPQLQRDAFGTTCEQYPVIISMKTKETDRQTNRKTDGQITV